MARLQLPQGQQVAPGQIPGVRADAPQSQGAQIVARQGQQFGQAVTQAGQQAGRIMMDVMERANTLRVNEAMNEARRRALELEYGEDGFRGRRGENAMPDAFDGRPLTQVYAEQYDEAVGEIGSRLGNSAQREAFQAQAAQLGMALRSQAQAHEFREFERYGASVLDGGILLATEEAATAFATPDRVAAAVAQIGVLGNERLSTYSGLSANEREARIQVLQSNAVVGVIRAAADEGDLSLARSYIERYDDVLTADAKLQLDALITPAMDAELARTIASEVFAGRDAPPAAGVSGEDVVLEAPVDGPVSSDFGPRTAPTTRNGQGSSQHGGRDFAVPVGTPVRAAGQGTVTFAGERGGYGNLVIVQHADGRETYYAHLSEMNVQVGQEVSSGAEIAKSGDTGNVSGAHLHFEVRVNGQAVDPSSQLGERNAGAARRAAGEPTRQGPPATRLEAEERALAALGPRATPEQVRMVRQEVGHQWTLRQQAQEQAQAQAVQAAQEWLVANDGNFTAMPPSVRSAIPAQYMDDVIRFADAVARPEQVRETPPEIYYHLQDDRELLALNDAEFMALRGVVRREDWENAARRRQNLRNPRPQGNAADPNLIPRARVNAIMNPLLVDMGLPPGGSSTGRQNVERRRQIGAIQQFIDGVVLDAQRQVGRQLTDAELRPLIGRLFAEQEVLNRGFFGGRRESSALSFSARHIRGSQHWPELRRHFEASGITNPTDSQIEIEFYRRVILGSSR